MTTAIDTLDDLTKRLLLLQKIHNDANELALINWLDSGGLESLRDSLKKWLVDQSTPQANLEPQPIQVGWTAYHTDSKGEFTFEAYPTATVGEIQEVLAKELKVPVKGIWPPIYNEIEDADSNDRYPDVMALIDKAPKPDEFGRKEFFVRVPVVVNGEYELVIYQSHNSIDKRTYKFPVDEKVYDVTTITGARDLGLSNHETDEQTIIPHDAVLLDYIYSHLDNQDAYIYFIE